MAEALRIVRVPAGTVVRPHPAWLAAPLAGAALLAATWQLHRLLPAAAWPAALLRPEPANIAEIVVHQAWLPRFLLAWLAGAALAAAGTVFQQVLRNPLAEPATLGTAAGAQFALQLAALWAPWLLGAGRDLVALIGGAAATLMVFAVAAPRRLAPLSVVLAGMVVSLLCAAGSTSLLLLHDHYLNLGAAFIWSSGTLDQQGWATLRSSMPSVCITLTVIALLARPLALFDLGEAGARSVGLWLTGSRLAMLGAAVATASLVVSVAGIISFIGLAGPLLARLAGARRVWERLIWAPLIGGALLCLTDQVIQSLEAGGGVLIPAGAAMAVLGVPLMLWQIWRLPVGADAVSGDRAIHPPGGRWPALFVVGACLGLAALALWLAVTVGRGLHGWHFSEAAEAAALLQWRLPRSMAAMAAGGMLALSGALLQRLTGNPLASPDLLGISSGAALGVVFALLWAPEMQGLAAAVGAGATLFTAIAVAAHTGLMSERVLVVGVALTALLGALSGILIAGGNLQSAALLNWLAGSTYGVSYTSTLVLCLVAMLLMALTPLLRRWVAILPLGLPAALALGVSPGWGNGSILAVASVAATAATVVVGPLGFVGLLAPHGAVLLGLRRPMPHLLGSTLLGGTIMICADWIGRNVMFPYELPAGLVATLIGAPGLIWLLARR